MTGCRKGEIYCRKCLGFQGKKFEKTTVNVCKQEPFLKYPLTKDQQKISDELIAKLDVDNKILIKAVCGAGKTEIVTKIIANTLNNQERVGFIIPRKDLIIEIGKRLQSIFPLCKVVQVYGGHTRHLKGDIVVCTAHQAYRYCKAFALIIIDEIDAFPYKGNELLKKLVLQTSYNKVVMMSATPSLEEEQENKVLRLMKRFHGKPLPVPKIIIDSLLFNYWKLKKKIQAYIKEGKPVFIYVPTILNGYKLEKKLIKKFKCIFVYSGRIDRHEVIEKIRKRGYEVVITTTILERGVTFPNLQVIVYNANHHVFTKEILVQIAGRVGRNINYPNGDVIFMAVKSSQAMKEAKKEIIQSNDL